MGLCPFDISRQASVAGEAGIGMPLLQGKGKPGMGMA
jgi:hypothetical protein